MSNQTIPQVFQNSSGKVAAVEGVEIKNQSIVSSFGHDYRVVGCRAVGVGFRLITERLDDGFQVEFKPTEVKLSANQTPTTQEMANQSIDQAMRDAGAVEVLPPAASDAPALPVHDQFLITKFRTFDSPDGGGFNLTLVYQGEPAAAVHQGGFGGPDQFHWTNTDAERVFMDAARSMGDIEPESILLGRLMDLHTVVTDCRKSEKKGMSFLSDRVTILSWKKPWSAEFEAEARKRSEHLQTGQWLAIAPATDAEIRAFALPHLLKSDDDAFFEQQAQSAKETEKQAPRDMDGSALVVAPSDQPTNDQRALAEEDEYRMAVGARDWAKAMDSVMAGEGVPLIWPTNSYGLLGKASEAQAHAIIASFKKAGYQTQGCGDGVKVFALGTTNTGVMLSDNGEGFDILSWTEDSNARASRVLDAQIEARRVERDMGDLVVEAAENNPDNVDAAVDELLSNKKPAGRRTTAPEGRQPSNARKGGLVDRCDDLAIYMRGIENYGDLMIKVKAVVCEPKDMKVLKGVVNDYRAADRNLGLARMNIGNRLRNMIKKGTASLPVVE